MFLEEQTFILLIIVRVIDRIIGTGTGRQVNLKPSERLILFFVDKLFD